MTTFADPFESAEAKEAALFKPFVFALAALLWSATGTAVEDSDGSIFSFGGFGTLGVVHSSEDRADFTSSVLKPRGAGHTHAWSAEVDSILGAQLSAEFSPQLSVMLQVISEQRYDHSYSPYVEWANVKYQLTPEISIRLGRTVLPSFLISDSRKVGYANPWVRPPIEVYSLVPVASSDGVDASYRLRMGEITHTVLGTYGLINTGLPAGGSARARDQWVVSDTMEYRSVTVRLSYQQAHVTVSPVNAFFESFRQFGPQGIALANRYDVDGKLVRFVGLGGSYDPGRGFVTGEWGSTDFHSVLGKRTGWYLTGGYRFGTLTPYLTYSEVKVHSDTSDPGLTLANLPPPLGGPATALNASLNRFLASISIQSTVSAGLRWDVIKNVAFKLQYDRSNLGAGSPGTLSNLQQDFRPGGTVHLFSATIDFVL